MEERSITSGNLAKRPTLSQQITVILRQEILANFKPGQSLPPIMELTKRFGVSYQTVREGISVLAAEGLVESRSGSGTYVSAMTKGRHVGVLAEMDIADPHTSYFARRVPQQLMRFFRQAGVPAKLYTGYFPEGEITPRPLICTEFLEAVERRQLSGVAALAPSYAFSQWCDTLRQQNVPIVGITDRCDYQVTYDVVNLMRMGAEYLLSRGRRRIALMDYCSPVGQPIPIEGFHATLAAAGAAVNPSWLRHNLHPCASGAGWEEFRAIWAEGRQKPDGLLICDDHLFPGAAMAILQMGIRVPEDLLVVTQVNKGSGMIIPFPVVKLAFDIDAYARTMGGVLIKLRRQETVENRRVVLPYELVEADAAEPQKNVAGDNSKPPRQDKELVMSGSV